MGLILAAILLLMAFFWFQRHLYPRTKLLLGTDDGALFSALVAALAATYAFFKAQVDEVSKFVLSLLDRPRASKILGVGIVAMVILLMGTRSIHISFEGTSANRDEEFELVIQERGRHLAPPFSLSRSHPNFLHLLWFSRPGPLEIALRKPVGFTSVRQDLGWGGTLRLHIPTDLKAKELNIIRIVPGWGLLEVLPGAASKTLYRLEIRFSGNLYSVPLHRQPVYLGGTAAELKAISLTEAPTDWLKRLKADLEPLTEDENRELERLAHTRPMYFPTKEIPPGEKLEIDLMLLGTNSPEVHRLGEYAVFRERLPQSIFLEDRVP